MNILCFGDSNTWGYKPDKTGRFDENTRWTALLQKKLDPEYHIIEEGLCGRTTVFQDELRESRRGLDMIGVTVEMHNPLDLVIIMLGTNDCKTRYGASASVIARGLDQVIRKHGSMHLSTLICLSSLRSILVMVSEKRILTRNSMRDLRSFPEISQMNTVKLHSKIMLLF